LNRIVGAGVAVSYCVGAWFVARRSRQEWRLQARLPTPHLKQVSLQITRHHLAESHAAAVRHTVIAREDTRGAMKKYRQLKIVTAAKQMASFHIVDFYKMNPSNIGG